MKLGAWPLGLVVVVAVAGCGGSSATAQPSPTAQPSATVDVEALRTAIVADYPVTDGSTSTHPLDRLLACDLFEVPCVWSADVSENVERTYVPDPAASVAEEDAQAVLAVKHYTTHTAYVNLIDGKSELLLEARPPSPDELAEAASKNVEFGVRPVALDAFVFLAHVENPVDSLTLSTIRDVYSGKITTWKKAGVTMADAGALIHPYQRRRNSGSQELMISLVMKDTPVIEAPDMIVETMIGPFNAIGGNPLTASPGDTLGLGYSVYYYATVMFHNENVKLIGVEGVKPTRQTITENTYPLVSPVYVVTRKDAPAGSTAVKFRDWLLTPDGQRVIEQSGYVPLP
jgi:phosphate transport system substrate-binding protein